MVKPTNNNWLKKLVTGQPHHIIGGEDNPYLRRWYLIPRNPLFNIYLHHFLRSDDDRALHDHPWYFLSFILKGGYYEHRDDNSRLHRKARSFALRRANTAHRVELESYMEYRQPESYEIAPGMFAQHAIHIPPVKHEIPVWTIFLTGPKIRHWGFYCPTGWIPWEIFDFQNGCE